MIFRGCHLDALFNSCNTGTSGLPDMYTRGPRAAGPRAEGVHIRQAMSACVTTVMLYFWHSENLPQSEDDCSAFLDTVGCGF